MIKIKSWHQLLLLVLVVATIVESFTFFPHHHSRFYHTNPHQYHHSRYYQPVQEYGNHGGQLSLSGVPTQHSQQGGSTFNDKEITDDPRYHTISSQEDILKLMKIISKVNNDIKSTANLTTTKSYNLILRELASISKSWAGLRAEEIFVFMLEQHLLDNNNDKSEKSENDDNNISIQPDIVTFNRYVSYR